MARLLTNSPFRSHPLKLIYVAQISRSVPVRIVSVCAGQGHDVIGASQDHPRADDVATRFASGLSEAER